MFNPWNRRADGEAGEAHAADASPPDQAEVEAEGGEPEVAGDADSPAPEAEQEGDVEAELRELKDRHLRLAAEFENFRKRTRKEQMEARTVAQAELILRILPTLDDLARVADTPHETTSVEALDEGIELILRNLRKQLGDAGLSQIEALGERFDPERHQAIMTTEVDDPVLDETISRVVQEGYEFQGRLVRPAQVEVRNYSEVEEG